MKRVLVLGSGGLQIGQAGEFDFSGSQALKSLKEEGIHTILVNPNIATIQTSEYLADTIYFLPVTPESVERIIAKERPEGILVSFGGQTALNCAVALHAQGVFERYGVRVLGTPIEAIIATEDRDLFKRTLAEIAVPVPPSSAATSVADALAAANRIGYPVIARAAYALGGLGSGFAKDDDELRELAVKAFALSPQVLIEKSLKGWKEVEYEMVRDAADDCIAVCNMENLDPLGIHTGDSIVVAPSQTLSNDEYHMLRKVAIRTIRRLGIIGECNIQFALSPESEEYYVIEVNARLSRSSALASKATGYPLAYVAAKLALGMRLTDIKNPVTKVTTACFEPSLDYIVVKMPRWDLKKFSRVSTALGSSMKSVGEVMAIGRSFEEALQKAVRMTETGLMGVVGDTLPFNGDALERPDDTRLLAVARALGHGTPVEEIRRRTGIDAWFLTRIANITAMERELRATPWAAVTPQALLNAKRLGFSDMQVGVLTGAPGGNRRDREAAVRERREALGIRPWVKQIDTLGAEWPAQTNYLYMTYHGEEHDIAFPARASVAVLGGGAYRIGSSVEFDWCCVSCVRTLRARGKEAIVINCNPETVSTDYDISDRLYFEELSLERVLDICALEHPEGVVVGMGGQTPNTLAPMLHAAGVPLLGTSADAIDMCEDREKFSALLDRLDIDQPEWARVTSVEDAERFAAQAGYPVLLRPSYVLSGAAMRVVARQEELDRCLREATRVSQEYPVVISKFIEHAKEIEMDCVADDGELLAYALSEHVEEAGVHSGDATLVLPAQKLYHETVRQIKRATRAIIRELRITGPCNIQYLAKDNRIRVIECNLRCSRTFPFVSKVLGMNFVELATRAMLGERPEKADKSLFDLDYVGVKAPQFSFTRLQGADPVLGVEMASTGEVACLGEHVEDAYLQALLSSGFRIPVKRVLLSTGPEEEKLEFLESARALHALGLPLCGTSGTARFLAARGIPCETVRWPDEPAPNVLTLLRERAVDLVINIPKSLEPHEVQNDYDIRRTAVDLGIPLVTNIHCAILLVKALHARPHAPKSWREYVKI